MNSYYVDLHIHIGRTATGKAVKITGSKSLTFTNIIDHAKNEKGLNMIGIIDCHSPEVLEEIQSLLHTGEMTELEDGGFSYHGLTVIPGSELEIYDENCKGPIHVLCYFSTFETMMRFSNWLSQYVKNIQLSSQRVYITGRNLQEKVKELEGLFIPAHVFTPFKSLYGKGVTQSISEVFHPDLIDGIELGLSADTFMADQLIELHRYPFVSNSDAHSLAKIAREYQVIDMEQPSFQELRLALTNKDNRRIVANFGLDPLLGKYHQTVCAKCFHAMSTSDVQCPKCGHEKFIKGVAERIQQLSISPSCKTKSEMIQTERQIRPPYIHQVPLEFIPGLGPKLRMNLMNHFGTEMAVLHEVSFDELKRVIPDKIAQLIVEARTGNLSVSAGGGGKFGKIERG